MSRSEFLDIPICGVGGLGLQGLRVKGLGLPG